MITISFHREDSLTQSQADQSGDPSSFDEQQLDEEDERAVDDAEQLINLKKSIIDYHR
jgi:hypothetical protein